MKIVLPDGRKIYGAKKFREALWISFVELRRQNYINDSLEGKLKEASDIKTKKIKGRWYILKDDIEKLTRLLELKV